MWSLEAGFSFLNKLIVLCHLKLKYNFSSAKEQFSTFFVKEKRNDTETYKTFIPPYIIHVCKIFLSSSKRKIGEACNE